MYIDRLLQEHHKLRDLGAKLADVVGVTQPCDLDELGCRRWDLARMVHQHLAYEEKQLCPRLENDPRPEVRTLAATHKMGIENLHNTYKVHIERWTNEEILSRWLEYQVAVLALVARMNARLDCEERQLFPALPREPAAERCWRPGTRNWAGDAIALQPMIQGFRSVADGDPPTKARSGLVMR